MTGKLVSPKEIVLNKRPLGRTGLEIAPLVFGGNVFGWTVDESVSFKLLDRFFDAGLNAIDTADIYSNWVPGNQGGESETIIGKWLKAAPGRRQQAVIITKVGMGAAPDGKGLSSGHILASAEASLRRLQTDCIDVYLSHTPDANTPLEETLSAYDTLIRHGKVRAIGCSNHDAVQTRAALDISATRNLPRYAVQQPGYNLYNRGDFEGPLRDLCIAENIGVMVFYSLAAGFLSGKYRTEADLAKGMRGKTVGKYLNPRGLRILEALDAVAAAHHAEPAEVALAWLITRPGVTAPIASATTVQQVDSLVRATQLALSTEEIQLLDAASNQ